MVVNFPDSGILYLKLNVAARFTPICIAETSYFLVRVMIGSDCVIIFSEGLESWKFGRQT